MTHPARPGLIPPALLAAGALLVAFGSRCPAQDEGPEEDEETVIVQPLDTDIFRHELHKLNLQPLRNLAEVRHEPHNTIIVLLGADSVNLFANWEVRLAVEQGATLLVASDQSSRGSQLSRLFGVEVTGDPVDADADDCYRGKRFHPFVQPFRTLFEIDNTSPRTVFKSLDRVGAGALATNNPSTLRLTPPGHPAKPERLAGYPLSARLQDDLFAAGGQWGAGRYLVLADHTIFLNFMVWKEDNANLFFARDCASWLVGPEGRTRCLFVEEGRIKTQFELKVPDKPMSWLKKFMFVKHVVENHGNQLVSEFEDKDVFNKLLLDNVGARPIIRFVLVLFTLFVMFYGFLMLVRNRVRADPARTLVTPELAAMIPRGSVLKQRFDAQLDTDNVYEAARQLVRDFMAGLDAEPGPDGLPPTLVVEDGHEDEAGLRRRIARLWRIGYDRSPVKVPPSEWADITEDLHDVLADADDGWWKFAPADRTEMGRG